MDKSKQKNITKTVDSDTMTSIGFGLIVVIIAGIMIFNYFQSNKNAQVSKDGQSTESAQLSANPNGVILPAEHTVVKGDNLWKIAEKYYQSGYNWTDIAQANKMSNPSSVEVGTKLTIPAVATKETTLPPMANTEKISNNEYTVVSGDNLWKIAVRAYGDGYAWTKIYKANETIGKNPGIIRTGMKLSIPR